MPFTEISAFPVFGLNKNRLCVGAAVNVYLALSHRFTILCCLDAGISTQMFTVFDLRLLFIGVNQHSVTDTFMSKVFRFFICVRTQSLLTSERASLAHPDANTEGPQNARRMC